MVNKDYLLSEKQRKQVKIIWNYVEEKKCG